MGTTSEFSDEVQRLFAFIAAKAAPRVVDAPGRGDSFADYFISLEGDALRVRVAYDRAQYLVDLSPLSPDWFDLDVILEFVIGSRLAADASPNAPLPLTEQVARIQRHYHVIVDAFRPEVWARSRVQLRALQEARGQRLFS